MDVFNNPFFPLCTISEGYRVAFYRIAEHLDMQEVRTYV